MTNQNLLLPSKAPSRERPAKAFPGLMVGVVAVLGVLLLMALIFFVGGRVYVLVPLLLFPTSGFFTVAPNQAVVLTFLGKYVGTVRENGFFWANPLAQRTSISLKVDNFQSEMVKVNDAAGNPVEIAAVVVWRVTDTARASFDVEDYRSFVSVQADTALRHLGTAYAYESGSPEAVSLRGQPDAVAAELRRDLGERLALAGVEVLDARISHLAYAPEIASAMLQRQQAEAVLQARQVIVEGAVGMVKMAIDQLEDDEVVQMSPERRADLVNNLLVVLTSERGAQPTLSASHR